MLARFSRFLTVTTTAALAFAFASCTHEAPVQPIRADVVAADTGGPPPSNDNRDSARFIPFVPFFDSTDVTNATVEAGEPTSVCHDSIGQPTRTVWYFFQSQAPGTVQLTAQLFGPAPGILSVYFDSSGVGLLPVGCSSSFGPVTFNADSGLGYFFQVSDSAGATGPTVFTLQQDTIVPPPPPPPPSGNDNFADARVIPGVPFSDSASFFEATREGGEPAACAFQQRTLWYAFTPTQTGVVSAQLQTPFFGSLAVYTGTSLNNLSLVGCTFSFNLFSFTAVAGTTYFIQVQTDQPSIGTFQLLPPPPPQANFFTQPFDPSTFDVVQFQDVSFDPVGVGFRPPQWSFGDGASASGFVVTHRYAADGDYLVELRVTTLDGRTASTARTLQVRTRDVAITKFAVPVAAMSGQTRSISVGVVSNRNAEIVTVTLFKSVPGFGGFQPIGVLQQSVPVRSANRTTNFAFSYTFTEDDAVIGKVTFRAIATIQAGRDALPADNEAIGSPTKVTR